MIAPIFIGVLFLLAACQSKKASEPVPPKPADQSAPPDRYAARKTSSLQRLLPQGATENQAKRFAEIHRFYETSIDWEAAVNLALRIPAAAPEAKLDALSVSALLSSLKGDTAHGFYQAHPEWVDAVYDKMADGKVGLGDGRGKTLEGFDVETGDFIAYDYEENIVNNSMPDLNPQNPRRRTAIIHELTHVFQDIQAKPMTRLQMERDAYVRSAEYLLFDEQALDEIAFQELMKTLYGNAEHPEPTIFAFHYVYYQAKGDRTKASEAYQELDRNIIRHYYLKRIYRQRFPAVARQVIADTLPAHKAKQTDGLLRKAEWEKDQATEELKIFLAEVQTTGADTFINAKVEAAVDKWAYWIVLRNFLEYLAMPPTVRPSKFEVKFDSLVQNALFQTMDETLLALRPLARIYRHFDGVD